MNYGGFKVIISNSTQNQVLSSKVSVSDDFRAKTNIWLAGFFGYTELLKYGEVIKNKNTNELIMSQATANELNKTLKQGINYG